MLKRIRTFLERYEEIEAEMGLPEVAGDAAILVGPEDVDGLRDAILRVIGDPDLSAGMRARGLRRAASFSWDRAAAESVAVFLEASRA